MLQREHSAILSTYIKFKTFVLSIFEWPFKTGFTVLNCLHYLMHYLVTNLIIFAVLTGLQIYGGPGSLSHDFKICPITFQGSGPIFSCEKSHFNKK